MFPSSTKQVRPCHQCVQRRAWHFPGDPRYGVDIIPPANDVACLRTKRFLSTAVLDYIIVIIYRLPLC
jgi:hypothetical protein